MDSKFFYSYIGAMVHDRFYDLGYECFFSSCSRLTTSSFLLSDNLMVVIPAREFIIGVPRWETGIWSDQRPYKVARDTFLIDLLEATNTNSQFNNFVEATGYRTDAEKEGWGTILVNPTLESTCTGDTIWQQHEGRDAVFPTDRDQHPIILVSLENTNAHYGWTGKGLTTVVERNTLLVQETRRNFGRVIHFPILTPLETLRTKHIGKPLHNGTGLLSSNTQTDSHVRLLSAHVFQTHGACIKWGCCEWVSGETFTNDQKARD